MGPRFQGHSSLLLKWGESDSTYAVQSQPKVGRQSLFYNVHTRARNVFSTMSTRAFPNRRQSRNYPRSGAKRPRKTNGEGLRRPWGTHREMKLEPVHANEMIIIWGGRTEQKLMVCTVGFLQQGQVASEPKGEIGHWWRETTSCDMKQFPCRTIFSHFFTDFKTYD